MNTQQKKRPFYIIQTSIDYDGYESYVDYVGDNFEAAVARYRWIREWLDEEYFEGYDPEDIEHDYTEPDKNATYANSYLNNQDNIYISVLFRVVHKNEFTVPRKEEIYKQQYPNAKY